LIRAQLKFSVRRHHVSTCLRGIKVLMAKNYADNLIQSCAAWSGELLMPPRVTYVCSLMP
jgi:hypothetical protein